MLNFNKFFNKINMEVNTEVSKALFNVNGKYEKSIIYIDFKNEEGDYVDIPVLINDSMFLGHQLVFEGRNFICINCIQKDDVETMGVDFSNVNILESILFNKESLERLIKEKLEIKDNYIIS